MLIADTNFLLRALGDQTEHERTARAYVSELRQQGSRLVVKVITIVELVYVLESSAAGYGLDRDGVIETVTTVLNEPAFDIEDTKAIERALELYKKHGFDFHDCVLAAHAQIDESGVVSFDRDFKKMDVAVEPGSKRV